MAPNGAGSESWPTVWRWLGAAGLVGLVAAVAWWLAPAVLTPFSLAIVLTYMVAPLVGVLERWLRLSRPAAILVAYACFAILIAAFCVFVLPDLVAELQRLVRDLPRTLATVQRAIGQVRSGYGRLPLPRDLRRAVDAGAAQVQGALMRAVHQALAGLIGAFGLVFALVLAPVLAYYTLLDLQRIQQAFGRLLPPGARQGVWACLADLDAVLSGWVRGQLTLAAVVGALATVALLVLGVRFALTLGLLAAMGELIPYFGPVLGALPALGVAAASGGWRLFAETAIAYLVIQQLEGSLLAPRIVGGAVGLHPLAVITALLVGDYLHGLAGVILSVPLAGCLRVLGIHAVGALTRLRQPRRLS